MQFLGWKLFTDMKLKSKGFIFENKLLSLDFCYITITSPTGIPKETLTFNESVHKLYHEIVGWKEENSVKKL